MPIMTGLQTRDAKDSVSPVLFVLKGYPRLSETFIAQEIRALEELGLPIRIFALRRPTDGKLHPIHREIEAPVSYLPEYLHEEPLRVARALMAGLPRASFWRTFAAVLRDFARDPTRNRLRRFGQALVLAHEMPDEVAHLHAHFIHTPASVVRYAARLTGRPWSVSAHAKDIWTSPDWDLRDKLTEARWATTCTQAGATQLDALAPAGRPVHLIYHGLDLARFRPLALPRTARNGTDPAAPVQLLSVGRAVEKKGFDLLLDALATLPADLHWRLVHIGGGEKLPALKEQADRLGLAERIDWRGAQAQEDVLAAYRGADLFVLPCRVADDGDRDGLPNVLVEAQSQALACLSTDVSGVPELIVDSETGRLVPPGDVPALVTALAALIADPAERARLGQAGQVRVQQAFSHREGAVRLAALFGLPATSTAMAAE
jgi:glycosyltransferase involved in cell wall biosynthesis